MEEFTITSMLSLLLLTTVAAVIMIWINVYNLLKDFFKKK